MSTLSCFHLNSTFEPTVSTAVHSSVMFVPLMAKNGDFGSSISLGFGVSSVSKRNRMPSDDAVISLKTDINIRYLRQVKLFFGSSSNRLARKLAG